MSEAFEQGRKAERASDNPYWKEYPNRAKTEDEEINARRWVDGYVFKIISERK